MNRFLVIGRVGDKSLHPQWLTGGTAHFDLYLSYFGDEPEKYREQAQYYEQVKGGKWPVLHRIVAENPDIISKYDAVWMPDDDLLADAPAINRMFALFEGLALDLAQPALSLDSYFSHSSLLQVPNSLVRYVNFIEVMAPIFSKHAMSVLTDSFGQSPSGWGLDNLWPHLLGNESKRQIAILDAVTVVHTRPVGGELYKKNPELSPARDTEKLATLYPQFDISRRSHQNKFRVFAEAALQVYTSDLKAFTVGKLQRIKNERRGDKTKKYGSS
ncbi:MAG: hypothetical protein U5L01_02430 [Rheinheimera sp.]|jgi:hypothetical protein|nr:hypothetical protein [Rheinheimera sp.]